MSFAVSVPQRCSDAGIIRVRNRTTALTCPGRTGREAWSYSRTNPKNPCVLCVAAVNVSVLLKPRLGEPQRAAVFRDRAYHLRGRAAGHGDEDVQCDLNLGGDQAGQVLDHFLGERSTLR